MSGKDPAQLCSWESSDPGVPQHSSRTATQCHAVCPTAGKVLWVQLPQHSSVGLCGAELELCWCYLSDQPLAPCLVSPAVLGCGEPGDSSAQAQTMPASSRAFHLSATRGLNHPSPSKSVLFMQRGSRISHPQPPQRLHPTRMLPHAPKGPAQGHRDGCAEPGVMDGRDGWQQGGRGRES